MNARLRLLLVAAAAVTAFAFKDQLLGGAPPERNAKAQPTRKPAGAARAAAPTDDICTTPAQLPSRSAWERGFNIDPFTAKLRESVRLAAAPKQAPPPSPVVLAPPPPPPPPAPPPPPVAPPLPYRFVGMVNEKNTPAQVYLSLNGVLVVAKAGDTIDGGFRLDRISARELVFTHMPLQQAVRMAINGEQP